MILLIFNSIFSVAPTDMHKASNSPGLRISNFILYCSLLVFLQNSYQELY